MTNEKLNLFQHQIETYTDSLYSYVTTSTPEENFYRNLGGSGTRVGCIKALVKNIQRSQQLRRTHNQHCGQFTTLSLTAFISSFSFMTVLSCHFN